MLTLRKVRGNLRASVIVMRNSHVWLEVAQAVLAHVCWVEIPDWRFVCLAKSENRAADDQPRIASSYDVVSRCLPEGSKYADEHARWVSKTAIEAFSIAEL